jgi:hypothetical protein
MAAGRQPAAGASCTLQATSARTRTARAENAAADLTLFDALEASG